MKKVIAFALVMIQTSVWAAAPSREYDFMKTTYNHMYQHQKLIEFYADVINLGKQSIETNCGNTAEGEECNITTPITITVTDDMVKASEVFYGDHEGFEVGDTVTLPADDVTLKKLADSRFTYALTIDLSKVDDDPRITSTTFSWNDTGDILRVYYEDAQGHNSSFILLKTPSGTKKMISNGYFDAGSEGGTYIMEVRLLDAASHKISETMSYYDFHNTTDYPNPGDREVTSKGVISDINGSVYLHPWAPDGMTFDAHGMTTCTCSWGSSPAIDTNDTENGAILKGTATGNRFVIVKEGKTAGKYTVLGYIFKGYDGSGFEYEYFGKQDLLAPKGAASDTDKLDIYRLDNKNRATVKVTGMWLTKEE